MTTLVCFLFPLPIVTLSTCSQNTLHCPQRLLKGEPWNAICLTYNYGLISNCLFLRIIPNGCAAKPLATLS